MCNDTSHRDPIEIAVLKEKVKRLETIVYGLIGFVALQLGGLFVLWAKQIFLNK
jgi:hypothetical protein